MFGGITFQDSHRFNVRDDGCQIVRKDAGHPVFDGSEVARFQVRPTDCSASTSFDDCKEDRSRHEIHEAPLAPTNGKTLTLTTRVFIPEQPRVKPRGNNRLFFTQINFMDDDGLYGTLAYLELRDAGLVIRTDEEFTFDIEKLYMVDPAPFGKWIEVKWEIRSTTASDGYIKAYVDGVLKVHEIRPTLPTAVAKNRLRIGIYNVFKSRALEPYGTQVVYFDGITKSVR